MVPSGDGEDAGEAFVREARAAARLHHPHVVAVFDAGRAEGHAYLAMEYMEGGNLEDLVAGQGALPEDQVVEIMREISRALLFAEEQGTVHRDVKPANIMLDGRGQVRITDFGLARLTSVEDTVGHRVGTPAYMAPEQLAGGAVTVQSDIYSLGLVLHEIFTGQTVYRADSISELVKLR